MCVRVCVAPPMVVGAWSMAEALRQLSEYYYITYIHVHVHMAHETNDMCSYIDRASTESVRTRWGLLGLTPVTYKS